ncbi:DUF2752 domain-containing protein [Flavobacterium sp. XGLA_31]|uniref:DUF2752 domain-containing protein n=1 Tax=Flavobacterium sp. XGLA_31 TaxID=3447666 RepID=UPI003F2BE7A0
MLSNNDNHLAKDQSFCPIKAVTGFPCPSCGITKSIVCFYQGDLERSLEYHILGPAVVFFGLFTIVLLLVELKTGKEYFNQYLYHKKAAYALAVFLAVYHIIRLVYFVHDHTWTEILRESIWK